MKKYLKNKNFIPDKFYNKVEEKNKRCEKGLLILFIMINLFMIPITMKNLMQNKEKTLDNKVNNQKVANSNISIKNINLWINSVIDDEINDVHIENNNGQIIVDNLDKIDELVSKKQICIKNFTRNDDGKYKLGVSLNE